VSEVSLAVEEREGRGKGAARKMRAGGRVPAVVYGGGKDPIAVSLDPGMLDRILRTHHAGVNALIDLSGSTGLGGRTVMVKDLDRDPIKGSIRHVDLIEVDTEKRIEVSIPVHLTGTPHGVTMGGMLDHELHKVDITCKAGSIPDELVIDVSHLDLGDALHVHQLELPAGAEMVTPAELPVASIVIPRGVTSAEEEGEVEGEEGAEAAEGGEEKAEAGADSDGDDD
jgi:large subunit ribosomal protein L25